MNTFKKLTGFLACILLLTSACKKDDYYVDGGRANPVFDGDILAYLESKPMEFDTIAQIVKLAGLEETFRNTEFTFFAPRDENIKTLIGALDRGGVNRELFYAGRDTIQTLADVDSAIWRKYLERYMFQGKNKLMDYPQIDFDLLNIYPGQNYISFANTVCNIGVVYNDANNIKYMGYRQLYISLIPDLSQPDTWVVQKVASSDVQPRNGVVHVIDFTSGEFGFNPWEVMNDIMESKR
jgi:hypothetical protein